MDNKSCVSCNAEQEQEGLCDVPMYRWELGTPAGLGLLIHTSLQQSHSNHAKAALLPHLVSVPLQTNLHAHEKTSISSP